MIFHKLTDKDGISCWIALHEVEAVEIHVTRDDQRVVITMKSREVYEATLDDRQMDLLEQRLDRISMANYATPPDPSSRRVLGP